jgi:hypothetical protein
VWFGGGVNVIQNFDLIVVFIFDPLIIAVGVMNFYDSGTAKATTFFFLTGGPLEPSTTNTIISIYEFI